MSSTTLVPRKQFSVSVVRNDYAHRAPIYVLEIDSSDGNVSVHFDSEQSALEFVGKHNFDVELRS